MHGNTERKTHRQTHGESRNVDRKPQRKIDLKTNKKTNRKVTRQTRNHICTCNLQDFCNGSAKFIFNTIIGLSPSLKTASISIPLVFVPGCPSATNDMKQNNNSLFGAMIYKA